DEATSLLVRKAQDAGLAVKGITRTNSVPSTLDGVQYTVLGIDVVVDGAMPQLIAYLSAMTAAEPALIPSLRSLTINNQDVAHAEITFNVYTKVVKPTPPPAPAVT